MTFTLVSWHAHPDDEVLLTGGTLARAAAEGHRVVLVVATCGESGLAAASLGPPESLAVRRTAELHRSAEALGCARVEILGYGDSGMNGEHLDSRDAFAAADPAEAAGRLAGLLREEKADLLTSYDARGGYGHPDHVQVHRVGGLAARLAGTPVVLEATVDRRLLQRALRLARVARRAPEGFDPRLYESAYADPDCITHRVDVRRHLDAKRAAMEAHHSQQTADGADRTLAFLLRLPPPLFRLVAGREWFVEHGRAVGRHRLDDVFASLR